MAAMTVHIECQMMCATVFGVRSVAAEMLEPVAQLYTISHGWTQFRQFLYAE